MDSCECNHKYKENNRKAYDRKAAEYSNTFDGRYCKQMYAGMMDELSAYSFESVLDLGCGTGIILDMILKKYPAVQLYGLDISPEMLKKAQELLGQKAVLVQGDSERLPWEDSAFDIVMCNASFHHYPAPNRVLQEIRRVLKPKGTIIISDPWWRNPVRFFINLYLASPFNRGGDVRVYSQKAYRELLTRNGFHEVVWKRPEQKYCLVTAVVRK